MQKYTLTYFLIPQLAKHVGVFAWVSHKLALEEGHVEAGGVVVYKLEEEHLHRQPVLILQVGLWNFCGIKSQHIFSSNDNTIVHLVGNSPDSLVCEAYVRKLTKLYKFKFHLKIKYQLQSFTVSY